MTKEVQDILLPSLHQEPQDVCYQVVIFDLTKTSDSKSLSKLLKSDTSISVFDKINSQFEELIRLRNPSITYSKKEIDAETNKILGGLPVTKYGNWVFYPWSKRLVHILPKEEFIEVRTNRNHNKISQQGVELLATKKIGIVGLSVGKAIANTIATERICGEIVLADFDTLELSNLNRIQTSVHNLGLKKTIIAAREIAEIDPYIKVSCISKGITEQNISNFFLDNGKLDICIEVCDDIEKKVTIREHAKEYGIPVVMDTNDRGMMDIERFDMDQSSSIFHGLLDHLDLSNISNLKSSQEKLPFVDAIIDFSSVSDGLKKSLPEIGKSISTWPQLASSVSLGAALTCNVCRRILLGKSITSGRYYVDIESIIKES
ncbi:ThiF family adenylyltransferase [Flavobacteriales bacterium]|nr:ThiF family adenylyltransferase [Flavobacteriales bacterium]